MKNVVKYHVLRQLMAKYGLKIGDIAEIIGKSYRQTIKKMNKDVSPNGSISMFDINEAYKIVKYFRAKGECVTVDAIFFGDMFSNENETA